MTAARLAIASPLALLVAGVCALSHSPSGAQALATQSQPNIIVITTDDQPLSMMHAKYMPRTVHEIGGAGTTFTNAVVTTPLCCPSRASMLTGEYAHNHGVVANFYGLLRDKSNVLPVWLRQAGYRTAHVGKFLNGYEAAVGDGAEVAPGWDTWFTTLGSTRYFNYDVSANGRRIHFGSGRRSHVTRVLNRKATSLVRRYTRDTKPLYLQLDQRAPHTETGINSGGRCGARAVPEVPSDDRRVRDEPLPTPPSFNEADISDKPSWVRDRPLLNGARIKRITKRYECGLAALLSVDRGVKQIIAALKQTHELDDTVLLFTSDNGFYFGEHRIARDKTHPYEEGIRVPLLIRVPQRYLGTAPVPVVHQQVANIDLAPTMLDLANAQPCSLEGDCRVMDGRSLMPLLRGGAGWPAGRAVLIEYDGAGSKGTSSCKYSAIRTSGKIYVDHVAAPDPVTGICQATEETELYDLSTDPFELQNLAPRDDPTTEALQQRLDRLETCVGVAGRDSAPPPDSSYCE